jgi:hypothetical protein
MTTPWCDRLALGEFTGDTASPAGELLNRCCLTVPGK